MDFDLTEEQSMLKDALDRLLTDTYSFEQRNAYLQSPEGWSPEVWNHLVEMGLTALPFAEADGGLGGGSEDIMIVMESLGRVLSLEPFFSTVVLGGGFIREGGDAGQRSLLVPLVADGSLKLAFAHTERNARYDLTHVETKAAKDDDGWILNGAKSLAIHGEIGRAHV